MSSAHTFTGQDIMEMHVIYHKDVLAFDPKPHPGHDLFVCDEVLWPSQPDGVMLSAVSLPNHTFTGQA